MFHFTVFVLIHSSIFLFFCCGIIVSLTYLEFASETGFGFTVALVILFPMNVPAALFATFLSAVFRASSLVFVGGKTFG